jgi:tetratricopeptide (TPR) repeat protein
MDRLAPACVSLSRTRRRRTLRTSFFVALLLGPGTIAAAAQSAADSGRAALPLADIAPAAAPMVRANSPDARADEEVAAAFAAAREHWDRGQLAQTVVDLDRALAAAHGDTYDMLMLLAEARIALRRPGEARVAAELAVAQRPAAPAAHRLLGNLHRRQDDSERAIAHLRAATLAPVADPPDPEVTLAWYELGEVLDETGYTTAAAAAWAAFDERIWETAPAHRGDERIAAILERRPHGMIEERLRLLQRVGDTDAAIAAARAAAEIRPDEPYLARLYVQTLLAEQRAAEAFAFCRAQLDQAGDDAAAPRAVALLALAIDAGSASGELDGWVMNLIADVDRGAQLELATRLAHRLDDAGRHHLSVRLWQALAAARPDDVDAMWSLAIARKRTGDLDAAFDALITFVRNNTDDAEIPPERLADWMRSFEASGAFLDIVRARTAAADCDFATYTVLGMTAAAGGQAELAANLLQAALEQRPDLALPHLAWGQARLRAYDWPGALEHATAALERRADWASALALKAAALAGLDRNEEATAAYEQALAQRPDAAPYALALGRHYRRIGDTLAAQRYFQQAWSNDPTLGPAVEELIASYLGANKLGIARDCLQRAEAADLPEDVLRRVRTMIRFAEQPLSLEHLAALRDQFAAHPDDAVTGLKLAYGLYIDRRWDEAAGVMQRVRALRPDDDEAMFLAAEVHAQRLEYDRAIDLLADLVARFPNRRGTLMALATMQQADFRWDAARQTLRRMLALDLTGEQRREVRLDLLQTWLLVGDYGTALDHLERWFAAEPDAPGWHRARLSTLIAADRGDEAVALAAERLGPVTDAFVEAEERYEALAAKYQERRSDTSLQTEVAEAEKALAAALEALYARRGEFVQTCLEAGAHDRAARQLRAWLALNPEHRKIREWLIEVLLAAGEGGEALEVLSEVVIKTPEDVLTAHLWQARGYAAAGQTNEAISTLKGLLAEGFIRESPLAMAQLRQQLVLLLSETGKHDEALELCAEWLAGLGELDHIERLQILTLRRFVENAAGQRDAALATAEQLLALDPYDPGINNDLGYTWAERGVQLDRAYEMIRRAVASDPLNAAYLDSLGWVSYKRGDFDAARRYLARAVQLVDGQHAIEFDHLGDAEYRLGDQSAARRAWERAINLLQRQRDDAALSPADTTLLAALRGKLQSLANRERPDVAAVGEAPASETP